MLDIERVLVVEGVTDREDVLVVDGVFDREAVLVEVDVPVEVEV